MIEGGWKAKEGLKKNCERKIVRRRMRADLVLKKNCDWSKIEKEREGRFVSERKL